MAGCTPATSGVSTPAAICTCSAASALIKRGGVPIAPRELEEAAQSVAGVRVAAAVGIASATKEEIVIAVEIANGESGADAIERVATAVRESAGFAPDRTIAVAPHAIPRTENGKIRHAALRSLIVSGDLPIIATLP